MHVYMHIYMCGDTHTLSHMGVHYKKHILPEGWHKVQRARYIISLASASHFLRISLPSFEENVMRHHLIIVVFLIALCRNSRSMDKSNPACSHLCYSLGVYMFPDWVSVWEWGIIRYLCFEEVVHLKLVLTWKCMKLLYKVSHWFPLLKISLA